MADKALQETSYVLEHQNRIKNILKDPGSAQFKESFISTSLDTYVVCGHVNSKNSFGAYGGFQRFVSAGTIQAIESDMPAGEMNSLWASACIKK